jgi:hypothetical protein
MMQKNMEGSGVERIEVLSRHLPAGTDERYKEPLSE